MCSRCAFLSGLVTLATFLVLPSALAAQDRPLREVIDAEVRAGWAHEKITPAPAAGDAEFLRRIYLDLVGTIPSYAETVAFLDSKEADKRSQLIDQLLADPRFAQHQSDVWDMLLFGRNPPGFDTQKRDGFQSWLRGNFEKNIPYDVWVRKLLKAEGNSVENGALYYVQYRNSPEDASEAISRTFLGVQLHCARCHDHPYEKWTQRDFYGVAAFLARLEVVQVGKKGNDPLFVIGERNSGDIQFTGPAKDAVPGKKGEPVKPRFLLGDTLKEPEAPAKEARFTANQLPPKPTFSRKDPLADWITGVNNPYFARAIANRMWAQFLGRGFIHPVDNLTPANKASHPALLDALTKAMIDHHFDLKWYIRALVNSQTYQLASAGKGSPLPDWFAYSRTRPLSAEELADAWRVATGYVEVEKAGVDKKSRFRPLEGSYVVQFFGTPNTGAGDFQGGVREHLFLNNGPLLQLITNGKGNLAEFVDDKKKPVSERVDRLFLSALNRRPSEKETVKFSKFLSDGGAAADAVWVLITCAEFRFNH